MLIKKDDFIFEQRFQSGSLKGKGIRVAIIVATFNGEISNGLLSGCEKGLDECNVSSDDVTVYTVDGCVEISLIAKKIAVKKLADVIICLGAVIKGDTVHFDFVCKAVTEGINHVALTCDIPVIFGILTTLNYEQALERSRNDDLNKGYESAITAIKTITLFTNI